MVALSEVPVRERTRAAFLGFVILRFGACRFATDFFDFFGLAAGADARALADFFLFAIIYII
jgi:hypothetical protein